MLSGTRILTYCKMSLTIQRGQDPICSHNTKYSSSATDHYHWNATAASEIYHSYETTYSTSIITEVCQNPQINTSLLQTAYHRHCNSTRKLCTDMELRYHHSILHNMHTHPFASYQALSFSCEPRWQHDSEMAQHAAVPCIAQSSASQHIPWKQSTKLSPQCADNTFNKPSVCLCFMEHGKKQMWATIDLWLRKQMLGCRFETAEAVVAC